MYPFPPLAQPVRPKNGPYTAPWQPPASNASQAIYQKGMGGMGPRDQVIDPQAAETSHPVGSAVGNPLTGPMTNWHTGNTGQQYDNLNRARKNQTGGSAGSPPVVPQTYSPTPATTADQETERQQKATEGDVNYDQPVPGATAAKGRKLPGKRKGRPLTMKKAATGGMLPGSSGIPDRAAGAPNPAEPPNNPYPQSTWNPTDVTTKTAAKGTKMPGVGPLRPSGGLPPVVPATPTLSPPEAAKGRTLANPNVTSTMETGLHKGPAELAVRPKTGEVQVLTKPDAIVQNPHQDPVSIYPTNASGIVQPIAPENQRNPGMAATGAVVGPLDVRNILSGARATSSSKIANTPLSTPAAAPLNRRGSELAATASLQPSPVTAFINHRVGLETDAHHNKFVGTMAQYNRNGHIDMGLAKEGLIKEYNNLSPEVQGEFQKAANGQAADLPGAGDFGLSGAGQVMSAGNTRQKPGLHSWERPEEMSRSIEPVNIRHPVPLPPLSDAPSAAVLANRAAVNAATPNTSSMMKLNPATGQYAPTQDTLNEVALDNAKLNGTAPKPASRSVLPAPVATPTPTPRTALPALAPDESRDAAGNLNINSKKYGTGTNKPVTDEMRDTIDNSVSEPTATPAAAAAPTPLKAFSPPTPPQDAPNPKPEKPAYPNSPANFNRSEQYSSPSAPVATKGGFGESTPEEATQGMGPSAPNYGSSNNPHRFNPAVVDFAKSLFTGWGEDGNEKPAPNQSAKGRTLPGQGRPLATMHKAPAKPVNPFDRLRPKNGFKMRP